MRVYMHMAASPSRAQYNWILTCHGGTPAPLWRGKRLLSPSDAILRPVRARPSEGRILGLWWFCLVPARLQASVAFALAPSSSSSREPSELERHAKPKHHDGREGELRHSTASGEVDQSSRRPANKARHMRVPERVPTDSADSPSDSGTPVVAMWFLVPGPGC
ncbi:hypothetical protein TrVGV298_001305 [Trichoderma virens]|nr:hypothetical protein TrVGV298_001305 [Trichoderma virens]